MLKADGYDEAIIGQGNQGTKSPVLVYDAEKVIDILCKRDGMTDKEALDYFYYKIEGAWVGESTPIFVWLNNED
jgi:carboxypeptidase C (cathepsin A)